jgi:glycosyltransferase involved in cell wall biosynthesis
VRDDVPALIGGFDAFAVSSAWEGIPGTIFEAMAAGVPIVATRVGGIPEVLEDGVNAILVESRDSGALAMGLRKLMQHPELGRRLAQRSAADVRERFTFARSASERLCWYRSLLSDKRRTTADLAD